MKVFLIVLSLIVLSCNNDWGESKCEYTVDEQAVMATRDMTYQVDHCDDTVGVWIWYPGIYRLHKSDSTVIDSLIY